MVRSILRAPAESLSPCAATVALCSSSSRRLPHLFGNDTNTPNFTRHLREVLPEEHVMFAPHVHLRDVTARPARTPLRSSSMCGPRGALGPSQAACVASTRPAILAGPPQVAARLYLQPRPLSLALPSRRACVGLASCPPQHGLRNAPCRVAPVCEVSPPQPAPRRARWLARLRAARSASGRRVCAVQVRAAQPLPFPVCCCSHTLWPRSLPALHLGRLSPCGSSALT